MPWKTCSLIAAMTAAAIVASAPAWAQSQPAGGYVPGVILLAACDPGDKIDGTTADEARKKIEAAGYKQVRDLTKGCDNFWHATAINKDGTAGNVLVTPEGEVKLDGN